MPEWLEMERELLAFKTGDQAAMLYGVLETTRPSPTIRPWRCWTSC